MFFLCGFLFLFVCLLICFCRVEGFSVCFFFLVVVVVGLFFTPTQVYTQRRCWASTITPLIFFGLREERLSEREKSVEISI